MHDENDMFVKLLNVDYGLFIANPVDIIFFMYSGGKNAGSCKRAY